MREIKFRTWDKNEKRFIDYFNAMPLIAADGTVYCHERPNNELSNLRWVKQELVIQQFTGLQDKNNKDIYEGDVLLAGPIDFEVISEKDGVRHVDTSKPLPLLDAPFYLGKVEYWPASFSLAIIKNLRANDSRGVPSVDLIPTSYSFEIIGNVFENPELCVK